MGQYYTVGLKFKNKTKYLNRQVEGCDFHIGAKLMEHSWFKNPFCLAVSESIYRRPSRIMWCGDYYEPEDFDEFPAKTKKELLRVAKRLNEEGCTSIKKVDFDLKDKFLVNHDKKIYIDLNEYFKQNVKDGWCIFPLSLLTAVGNGRGGGDYRGIGFEDCGSWLWDLVSIESEVPEKYEKTNYDFFEE